VDAVDTEVGRLCRELRNALALESCEMCPIASFLCNIRQELTGKHEDVFGHRPSFIFFILKFLLFYYSYVHTMLGALLPPAPSLSPNPLNTWQKLFCPYL
jgi:hypothetical protein